MAAINGYALYRYRTTSEPLSQGLRVSIIVSSTAGMLDGIYQAMNSSSWKMGYAIGCAVAEGSIAIYHSGALVYQTMLANPNFTASNYAFLKRSFILQAEYLINEMNNLKKEFTDEECRIMKHSVNCDMAKIRTVFGRTVTQDACVTIIKCYDRYQKALMFKPKHYQTFFMDMEQLQMLIVPTQKALDYLLNPLNT